MPNYIEKTVDGFNWILDIQDGGIGSSLYKASSTGANYDFAREKVFMNILDETVKEGMTCIDLGANIGYATMFMIRNVSPAGNVYAIEPDPHNIKYLNANLSQNGYMDRCEITRCAITDKNGLSQFWISDRPNLNSVNKTRHSVREETVPCFTLGTFCEQREYPNFIKMDIEGHEVKVFESGLDYFDRNSGETHILLEVHPKEYDDENDFAKILREYSKIGFRISHMVSTPVPNPRPFHELGYTPIKEMKSDGWVRSLYKDIEIKDGIMLATELFDDIPNGKVVRSMMVSRDV